MSGRWSGGCGPSSRCARARNLHSRRGADSGEISLYVTPEEYWLFTSVPAERRLRQAAIARHKGDVWAAVRELARGERPPQAAPGSPIRIVAGRA